MPEAAAAIPTGDEGAEAPGRARGTLFGAVGARAREPIRLRPRAKVATTAISRQRNSRRSASVRAGLLWGLALIGLLLLPSDYRAGAEAAHGHTLMHLWLDAADGAVHHHQEPGGQGAAWDWLKPSVAGAEPAYLGQPNALSLSVEEYATGGTEPVNDLAATLEAEVSKDGQAMPLSLVQTGEGEYEAPFVPTEVGDYTFRIFGAIGEAAVDVSGASGPSTFNSVAPLTGIEFPVQRPDAAAVQATMAEAEAAAGMARALAIASIAAGVLGVILGAVALARSGRAKPGAAAPSATAVAANEPSGKLIR